ncbi:large conductance mechanosensitive channel protein MscL [Cellulomonas shaoxiangyii]|uniref:Large-conductance mechanosensitive channel n=1 Tax=Cellulomonas shaoxiangyii TaxID=2566013 RepID=A0A4V1CMX6_9CELL|nr:large conductance mechanosensitive channel protein MscL [Cellulomonas shaoxiangyii]QCB94475.1 large conductance mechanosensitive channel protein MscL [Cellulomonas shaoxiangyii]TGY86057.1 large conductance mechanosensitive channel protein MscL [Cellulomonas shaoxiangyii]
MSENARDRRRGAGDRLRTVGSSERLKGMSKVLQGFKDFVSRGNAVELAVGVVIGAAFTAIVGAIQDGLLSPLIGWIFGQPNLEQLWNVGPYSWQEGADPVRLGLILNALLQFLLTAAGIYFLIVLPLNALAARRKRGQEEEPQAPSEDVLLLQEIRDLLAAQASPAVRNDAAPGGGTPDGPTPGTAAGAPPAGGAPPSIPPGPGPA